MAQPDLEFVKCKGCKAWRKIEGQPLNEELRFCVLLPRSVVLGNPQVVADPFFHIISGAFSSVYPVQSKNDGCFYGVPKGHGGGPP